MDELIAVIDTSEIREGKLDELEAAIGELVEFVEAKEADPLAYRVHITDDGTRMTVLQVHPSSASMEFHMDVAGSAFPKFKELLRLRTMDVYGTPSERLLDQLRQKADMLGGVPVVVHRLHAGFDRFGR